MSEEAGKYGTEPKLVWQIDDYKCWRMLVPVVGNRPEQPGFYDIQIQRRPAYCNRGDWIIYVDGVNNDIDGADGFPRYFFGSETEVKQQMEMWVARRKKFRDLL